MSSRTELHEAIDELSDEQVDLVKKTVEDLLRQSDDEALRQALMKIPGIQIGKEVDPERKQFVPIKVEGELVSEQLIRDR